ncbi:tetrahydrofolylpolyglutamate synthase [Fusarium albosuccineum]|uniref:Tetrahydrofolylpolyglutamate synthase n=1 Tax=Fusarium albosuccineum TaxID=1237068 RepID=A0A8H4LMJ7_9HYPO|nr:tetrahydrofolylpolyglutamate synthase [Fusarium albosuccineum]
MSSSRELQFLINRIYRALATKKKKTGSQRDIRLGLDRINLVVPDNQEWKGIHVAGTNGKGSICAYLAGLFKLEGLGYGSFTSPAFPERHNGVTINGQYVNPRMYEMEVQHVEAKWNRLATGWTFKSGLDRQGLSPFELETATAFRVFNKMHVPYGIVEVGMGGATDATNAMKDKAVTVISKIGLDHQEFLGNNLEKIAKVKAGIMRRGIPCIVDHTNRPSVIRVLRDHARQVGTDIILTWKAESFLMSLDNKKWKLEGYQIQNLLCAALAFRTLFPEKEINLDRLLGINPFLPGRMEMVKVDPPASGLESREILVDGAHNMLGIEGLVSHVDKLMRKKGQPVTWVMGMSSSKHKPFHEIINKVVQPHDNFAFVEFTQGPNDPQPAPANFGADHGKTIVKSAKQVYDGEPNIASALPWACDKAGKNGPVVVTGSLYLIRELFSLEGVHRAREPDTRKPGRAQLYQYTELAKDKELTEEEAQEFKRARQHFDLSAIRRKNLANASESGEPRAPKPSTETAELQRKARHHKEQEEGYQKTITAIQKDIKQLKADDTEESHKIRQTLAARLKDIRKQAARHGKEFKDTMNKLGGQRVIPFKKHLNYRDIFGRPKKAKPPPRSPFLTPGAKSAPAEHTSKVTWDNQKVDEKAALAQQNQDKKILRKKLAAQKTEKTKESQDPFAAKLASGRRRF